MPRSGSTYLRAVVVHLSYQFRRQAVPAYLRAEGPHAAARQ